MPRVPAGFSIERIATVRGARELAMTSRGNLFVGTLGRDVYLIANAEAAKPAAPRVFVRFDDSPAAGVAASASALYVGTQFAVWRVAYRPGEISAAAAPQRLASVRTSNISEDHVTTSVAIAHGMLYASVGSNCDACDPTADVTRATVGRVWGGSYHIVAKRIRNAIALAADPATGALWAGVAGEDNLPVGHPFEIFDDVLAHHRAPVDYGWPYCYENRKENPVPRWHGRSCARAAVPRVIFPAYETPIGAVFYPAHPSGLYRFPKRYDGGAFVTLHGSWHGPAQGLSGFMPPRVVFVPMNGDRPLRPANWSDPRTQWSDFLSGYQRGASSYRIGRPTGIAIGPEGDLFVADDLTGAVYRVRPISRRKIPAKDGARSSADSPGRAPDRP